MPTMQIRGKTVFSVNLQYSEKKIVEITVHALKLPRIRSNWKQLRSVKPE